MDKRIEANLTAERKGRLRYMVALLLLCGVLLNYVIKTMLSVAIVAMVIDDDDDVDSNSTVANYTLVDVCPGKAPVSDSNENKGVFDWDAGMQGHILSSYFYGYVATQFIGGWASDRFGGRWVFGLGVMLTGLMSVFSPLAANVDPVAFMVLRALQGVFSGVLIPSINGVMSKWFTLTERPRIAGLVFSANYGGTLIAMSLSGVLIEAFGWSSVFYVFGGLCVVFCLPWFYFAYDSPDVHPRISDGERELIVTGRRMKVEYTNPENDTKVSLPVPWLKILTSVPLWASILMHSGTTWLNYTLLTELPTYSKKVLYFDVEDSGLISALPYLFAWIFGGLFGITGSWLRGRGYISQLGAYRIFNGIAAIGPAIFLLVITLVGCDTTAIVVCLVVTATLKCAFYAGSVTNVLDLAPNFAGTLSGFLYTVANLPGIITPQVTAVVVNGHHTLSRWHTVFYISVACCLVPYILYFIFGTVEEQSWNNPNVDDEEEKSEKSKIAA